MSTLEALLAWFETQRCTLRERLDQLEAGELRIFEARPHSLAEVTPDWITEWRRELEAVEAQIVQLERLNA